MVKKKIIGLMTIMMMLIPEMVLARKVTYVACGNSHGIPEPVPQMTSIAYTLLIVGTPLVLIAFSVITLVKAMTAGSSEDVMKAKAKLVKKFLAAGLVFVVAAITQFLVTQAATASEEGAVIDCIQCFLYNSGCDPSDSGNDVRLPDGSSSTSGRESAPNSGESLNPNNPPANNTATGIIFVGDSRTVGMCGQSTSTLFAGTCKSEYAVAQTSMGYSWLDSTAVSQVNSKLSQDTSIKYNIVILLGVNDLGNSASYLTKIKALATGDWKDHNIIFVSVTNVDETPAVAAGYTLKNTQISTFNSSMKSGISSASSSNLSYCDITTGLDVTGRTTDGVHYASELYTEIYNSLKSKCIK